MTSESDALVAGLGAEPEAGVEYMRDFLAYFASSVSSAAYLRVAAAWAVSAWNHNSPTTSIDRRDFTLHQISSLTPP